MDVSSYIHVVLTWHCIDVWTSNPYLWSQTHAHHYSKWWRTKGWWPSILWAAANWGEYEWSPLALVMVPLLVWTHCINAPQILCRFEGCGWTAKISAGVAWVILDILVCGWQLGPTSQKLLHKLDCSPRCLFATVHCPGSAIANFDNMEIKDDGYQDRHRYLHTSLNWEKSCEPLCSSTSDCAQHKLIWDCVEHLMPSKHLLIWQAM